MSGAEPPIHTGVDHVHAHPRHVGHRPVDLILALTAVFISAVSLYVAIDHGRTERQLVSENARLVQANSWPFLQMDGRFNKDGPTTLTLVNAGIGPAKLDSLVVLLDGKPVDDIQTLLQDCCDYPDDEAGRHALAPDGVSTWNLNNGVLRPGESASAIVVPSTAGNNTLNRRFIGQSRRISFRACYCSVFDTCWVTNLTSLRPREVQQCPVEPHAFNRMTQ